MHRAQAEQQRPNVDVRRWYRTARWKALRKQVLSEGPCCVLCRLDGTVRPATEVDHRVPHRDQPDVFWDRANLQGLCASCHAWKTRQGL